MVTLKQLSEIPYLDTSELGDRFLTTLTFFDGDWHMWLLAGDQREQLVKVKGWPAEASYFSKTAENENDLHFVFLDQLAQRACFTGMEKPLNAITDDIHNLSASLAKLNLLFENREAVPNGLSRMITTEIEYIIVVCRSLFDFLQEFMQKLWSRVFLLDQTIQKQRLKPSFNGMINFKGRPSNAEDISERFGLPKNVAQCYERGGHLFRTLRILRDNVVHKGSTVPHVFVGERAFLIDENRLPFTDLLIWDDDEREPNDLVPLVPMLETLIYRTLSQCNDFMIEIGRAIRLPGPVDPDMHLFLRGYFMNELRNAIETGATRTRIIQEVSSTAQ